jgi:hypothetical protein
MVYKPEKRSCQEKNTGDLKKDLRGGATAPTGFSVPILAIALFKYS